MKSVCGHQLGARKYWCALFIIEIVLSLGCEGGPTPRLPDYWDLNLRKQEGATGDELVPHNPRVGWVVISDGTAPGLAPPLSPSMLDILVSKTFTKIKDECQPPRFHRLASRSQKAGESTSILRELVTTSPVDHLMVLIFSGTEFTSPAVFGEERMMTQLHGTSTHNVTLAEVALIGVRRGTLLAYQIGEGEETLDRLTVPLGKDALPLDQALDVLRVNASNNAWENVKEDFLKVCKTLYHVSSIK